MSLKPGPLQAVPKCGEGCVHHVQKGIVRLGGLAFCVRQWQKMRMTEPKKSDPRAAGGPLALSILAGGLIGVLYQQSTLGLLAGSALGVVIALAFWMFDRKR